MGITIRVLGVLGDETLTDLSVEEAEKIIEEVEIKEGKRYFVLDMQTNKVLKEIKLEPNQRLALIPVVAGG